MAKEASKELVERAKPRQMPHAAAGIDQDVIEDDNQIVLALSRGLEILEAFRRTDLGLGNAELAKRTGLTRPTVSRLAYTLARHGFLSFDQRRREYRLGVKAITLGSTALAMTNVRTLALPLMREFATASHFNVGLGTRDGHQMVYTDACEGDALIALRLFPGSRMPIASSAMGRAYLSSLHEEERARLLEELRPRYDDEWPRIVLGVEQARKELDELGFCLSVGDWQKDIHGVAIPIRGIVGQATYVINLGGPAYMLPEADMRETLGPKLRDIVHMVERQLGTYA